MFIVCRNISVAQDRIVTYRESELTIAAGG
jgi:hypothetical protein